MPVAGTPSSSRPVDGPAPGARPCRGGRTRRRASPRTPGNHPLPHLVFLPDVLPFPRRAGQQCQFIAPGHARAFGVQCGAATEPPGCDHSLNRRYTRRQTRRYSLDRHTHTPRAPVIPRRRVCHAYQSVLATRRRRQPRRAHDSPGNCRTGITRPKALDATVAARQRVPPMGPFELMVRTSNTLSREPSRTRTPDLLAGRPGSPQRESYNGQFVPRGQYRSRDSRRHRLCTLCRKCIFRRHPWDDWASHTGRHAFGNSSHGHSPRRRVAQNSEIAARIPGNGHVRTVASGRTRRQGHTRHPDIPVPPLSRSP